MSTPQFAFGPRQEPGFLLGLRSSQAAVLAGGLAAVVAAFVALPLPANAAAAALLAAAATLVAFVPVAGRTVEQWTPVIVRWSWQRATGRHRFRSTAPEQGLASSGEVPVDLPETLDGLAIQAVEVPGGGTLGVLHDRRADAYTALLRIEGDAFALLDSAEKLLRLQAWAEVLRGFGGEASPVHRIQWIERAAPDDGDALGRDLHDRLAVPATDASARSYLEVLDDAGPVTKHHETYLAVQITPRRAQRAMRQTGKPKHAAAGAVLVDQLRRLEQRLLRADLRVISGGLGPRALARVLRLAVDPAARASLARRALHHPENAGVDPASAWPLATDTAWDCYHTDSGVHVTYWISEWPRTPVGEDFLAPLLFETSCERTISVVMAPVGRQAAMREAELARTSELAEEQLRARKGFLTSHRKRREQEAIEQRAAELQEGHGEFCFSGYVTVTAATEAEVADACAAVVAAAEQSGLELRRLVGAQDVAFAYTLPLGRGLR